MFKNTFLVLMGLKLESFAVLFSIDIVFFSKEIKTNVFTETVISIANKIASSSSCSTGSRLRSSIFHQKTIYYLDKITICKFSENKLASFGKSSNSPLNWSLGRIQT